MCLKFDCITFQIGVVEFLNWALIKIYYILTYHIYIIRYYYLWRYLNMLFRQVVQKSDLYSQWIPYQLFIRKRTEWNNFRCDVAAPEGRPNAKIVMTKGMAYEFLE